MALRTPLKSNVLLLAAAAIWGLSFVAQKAGMEHVGPFTFNVARSLLGTLTLIPLLLLGGHGTFAGPGRLVVPGLLLGWVLFGGVTLMQFGLLHTTAGKAGFINGLYVVLVPLIGLILGRVVSRHVWLGVSLAISGLYFLSITDGLRPGLGDMLILGSALCWALHMILIDRYVRDIDPVLLSVIQFAVCTVLSGFAAWSFETFNWRDIRAAWLTITYAGVMSIGVALTIQAVAQRDAHPAHAAIILCLEGAIAAFAGWLILGEVLTGRMALGCVLIVAGMLSSQWPLLRLKFRH